MGLKGLWRNADFIKLWAGQTVSVFGSMIGGTAMTFVAILALKATPLQMGLLNVMQMLPAFLVGLLAGAWVDRLHRRPFLIAADIGRALVLATIPLAALLGKLGILQVYLVTVIVSILTVFFDVAYRSYLPALVAKDELLEGNSKLTASAAVAEFGGFSLGGWLVQALTAPFAILIDAASFVISAVSVGFIRKREVHTLAEESPDLRSEIVEGVREVWQHPLLRTCAAAILTQSLANGVYGALVVLFMSRGLGFPPGILGMTWAVGGVSSFLGATLVPRLTGRFGAGRVMVAGLAVYGLTGLVLLLGNGANWFSALLLVLAQLGDGFFVAYEINLINLRQSITPERLLGRVNATMQFLFVGASLFGSLAGGALGQVLPIRLVLLIGGSGTLIGALILFFSPVRKIEG